MVDDIMYLLGVGLLIIIPLYAVCLCLLLWAIIRFIRKTDSLTPEQVQEVGLALRLACRAISRKPKLRRAIAKAIGRHTPVGEAAFEAVTERKA